MENYIEQLRTYVADHKITFVEESAEPCLDSLWWHYGETHSMSSTATKEGFRLLRDSLSGMLPKDADEVIAQVGCLCAEHERIAFVAGLRLGAQLILEIKKEMVIQDSEPH